MSHSRRAFRSVAGLIANRLKGIGAPLIMRLWAHVVRYLVGYLVFERL